MRPIHPFGVILGKNGGITNTSCKCFIKQPQKSGKMRGNYEY
jgi:hypothetical protein